MLTSLRKKLFFKWYFGGGGDVKPLRVILCLEVRELPLYVYIFIFMKLFLKSFFGGDFGTDQIDQEIGT